MLKIMFCIIDAEISLMFSDKIILKEDKVTG
jgi:hypothetical protein